MVKYVNKFEMLSVIKNNSFKTLSVITRVDRTCFSQLMLFFLLCFFSWKYFKNYLACFLDNSIF